MQFNNTLQDICKTSVMKATAAMSKFLNTPIKFDMKPIKIEPIQKVDIPSHFNESTVCLYASINSSIKGGSMLMSSTKSALATCDLMLSRTEGDTNEITEVEVSALKELTNIVLGNFLTTFAHSLFSKAMIHSPATYEQDMSMVITKHMRSVLSNLIDGNSVLNITFTYEHSNIKGEITIILDEDKINYLLRKMVALTNG